MRSSLFLLLFITTGFYCQIINKQKQLNLQSNELYLQNISEFIDDAATQIILPTQEGVQQIQAYQEIITYKNTEPIEQLAQFDYDQVKYIIGVSSKAISDSKYYFEVIFLKIEFNTACKCLVQTKICVVASEIVSKIPEIFASIYNIKGGLVSYQIDREFYTQKFQLDGSYISYFNWLKLNQHVSIQDQDQSIYIIQEMNQKYQLIKINKYMVQIFIKEIPADDCDFSAPLIDSGRFYFRYCHKNNQTSLKAFWIDEFTETLSFQNFDNLSEQVPTSYTFKRIGSKFLIGLFGKNSFNILKLSSNQSINNFIFTLQNIQVPFGVVGNAVFVNENFLSFYLDNLLLFFDIDQKQLVYQTQACNEGQIIKFAQSLGNQIMFSFIDSNQKYSSSIVAQVNLPSLVIQLAESTANAPIQVQIVTVSHTINFVINVNINQQNKVLFTSDKVIKYNNIKILQENQVQFFPIEDQVIGSDLQLDVSVNQQSQQYLKNVSFIKKLDLDILQDDFPSISHNCDSYQIDGYFSSLFVCPSESGFQIQYARAYSNFEDQIGFALAYKSQIDIPLPIYLVDNYGSFTLKQTNFTIYLPYLDKQNLSFARYVLLCDDQNFQFASDPAHEIFFTYCNNAIQMYQYKNNNKYASKSKTFNYNTSFSKLICIDGILFAYNDKEITAYDYIQFSFLGQITIPTEGSNQQLTLFKSTFLITIMENPLTKIAQYSYNNFASSTPSFMRYLQIDSNHPVDSQGIILAKRSDIELAFVLSKTANLYHVYRVNSKQWSNQLYTSISFNLQQTIINNLNICQLNPPLFQLILYQASIKYELGLTKEQFSQNLFWSAQITLSSISDSKPTKEENQSEQQQILEYLQSDVNKRRRLQSNSIQFNLAFNRDASAAFCLINQQSSIIQQLKTQAQDIQFSENQSLYYINFSQDTSVCNSCVVGWQSLLLTTQIIQRIFLTGFQTSNQEFTIMYKYRLQIQDYQIKSIFLIEGNFKNCVVLDDKASLKISSQTSSMNYQFDVYVLCKQYAILYKVNSLVDFQQTEDNYSSSVSDPVVYYFTDKYPLSIYTQLISYNNQLYLFSSGGMDPQLLTFNLQKQASIKQISNSQFVKRSINYLNNYNLYLQIFSSGLIQFQEVSQQTIQTVYIQDMLSSFNFIINSSDYINSVEQYSFSQFRIQFASSFIYDVTFQLNDKKELYIKSAAQYYYLDAFSQYVSGFKGSKYTILFGYSNTQQLNLALYDNSDSGKNTYLIQSVLFNLRVAQNETPTFITETSPQSLQLVLSNGKDYRINISDYIIIEVNNFQYYFRQNSIQIAPLIQNNLNNTITMNIPNSIKKKSSYIYNLFYNIISFLIIICI
ncbi:hypothetical protein ABPG74_019981 [Tetrahymena malaccensis]